MLKKVLKKRIGEDTVKTFSHTDILKALRDQALDCTFISIAAVDRDQANRISAVLNVKGKRPVYIDLTKNKIFEELRDSVIGALAEERWGEIKSILNTGDETVGLATSFRHYWISKYQRCNATALYGNFIKIINKNESAYQQSLEDFRLNARNYMEMVNLKREGYNNRKEYFWLIQSSNTMNKTFSIIQTRIALLALYDVKEREIISSDQLRKAILAMENFHFAFAAICSLRTSNLESIYFRFTIALRKSTDRSETSAIVQRKLIEPLDKLCPGYDLFAIRFKELLFVKRDSPLNIKTKYAIYKLNSRFGDKETLEDDGSIEHILPEATEGHTLSIGNLILLEGKINSDVGNKCYVDKIPFYEQSKYPWMAKFINSNPKWNDEMIDKRATKLATIYYKAILEKDLPIDIGINIETIV